MANMADFEGAVQMYAELHDKASFGMHSNLIEGEPLLKNQEQLDYGFYKTAENCSTDSARHR